MISRTTRARLATTALVLSILATSCAESEVVSLPVGESPTPPTSEASPTSEPPPTSESLPETDEVSSDELFPDVLSATATHDVDGSWTISATLSSPYDSRERYADSWRVLGPDGTVYGERFLTHDHASEQPFTRSQSNIEIPDSVTEVTIEGRDQVSGWGGGTATITLDR